MVDLLTSTVNNQIELIKIQRGWWDSDGYADRGQMFARWLEEWPETGLDMASLARWYRSEMDRQVKPDMEVNGFLAQLNERRVPWGIVTNGRTSQHGKCRAAGLDRLAPFIISLRPMV